MFICISLISYTVSAIPAAVMAFCNETYTSDCPASFSGNYLLPVLLAGTLLSYPFYFGFENNINPQ